MSSFNNSNAVRIALVAFALCCMAVPRVGVAEEKKKTELNNRMEEMDTSFKKLKSSIRSAQQDAQSLELIGKIEQLAITCKAMTPSKAATVPADKRDAFL